MCATKNTHECLWHERWPVWGYVGVKSAQSSLHLYLITHCVFCTYLCDKTVSYCSFVEDIIKYLNFFVDLKMGQEM